MAGVEFDQPASHRRILPPSACITFLGVDGTAVKEVKHNPRAQRRRNVVRQEANGEVEQDMEEGFDLVLDDQSSPWVV